MKYKNQQIKIIKTILPQEEEAKDKKEKQETWYQIEILEGKEKGMRRPVPKKELTP